MRTFWRGRWRGPRPLLPADLLRRARPQLDGVVITIARASLPALAPLLAAVP